MSSQPGCPCSVCDEDQESSVPENEYAERTVTGSDPHSFYCPQCRTTYDFPWLRAQDCTCIPIQDFIVQHSASHDTKRLQVNTSVNIRSAEKLGLVDDARESAARLPVDLPQDLRTRIAAAIEAADDDYAIDQTNAYLNLADAVIRELRLSVDRGVIIGCDGKCATNECGCPRWDET